MNIIDKDIVVKNTKEKIQQMDRIYFIFLFQ